jgi:hypothetical protein
LIASPSTLVRTKAPRGGGGEDLGGVDAGRGGRGRHAERQQHGGGDDAVRHAQGAVDDLGQKADEQEEKEIVHGRSEDRTSCDLFS